MYCDIIYLPLLGTVKQPGCRYAVLAYSMKKNPSLGAKTAPSTPRKTKRPMNDHRPLGIILIYFLYYISLVWNGTGANVKSRPTNSAGKGRVTPAQMRLPTLCRIPNIANGASLRRRDIRLGPPCQLPNPRAVAPSPPHARTESQRIAPIHKIYIWDTPLHLNSIR